MKVLILTCHTGEGHNSTAGAVRDVLQSHNVCCESADTLAFLSPLVSRVVRRAHERIYRYIPKAFSVGYRAAEQTPEAFERKSLLYSLLTRGAKKLHRFVIEGGYDTIVCTHAFSAVLTTGLLEKYPDCKVYTAFVATDYTCSPSVKESRLDAYFIPDEGIREDFTSKGIPTERIFPAGLPVRAPFLTSLSREEAAAALEASVPIRSLSEAAYGGDEDAPTLEATLADGNESERTLDRLALSLAIDKLPPMRKKILLLRYYRDYSQAETAKALGLTQVKISREEKKIIEFLRQELS
jgi:RNA polymerase sigma factor (sigma-70 family)